MLLRAISVERAASSINQLLIHSITVFFSCQRMDLKSMAHAVEAASKYSYDSVADQWHREIVWVRIDDEPFAMVMMLRAVVGDNALSPCVRGSLTQCMWTWLYVLHQWLSL